MKVAERMGWPEVALVPLLNPDPVAHFVGDSNEAPVIVDRQGMNTLIDSGAQVPRISSQFCEDLALHIQPLGQLLELEGTGGSAIPYLRFLEVNLQILWIKKLQWVCAVAGHTNHDLFWDGLSHGWIENYR